MHPSTVARFFLEHSSSTFVFFSLQQLLVSAGDQQRLQSVLSSVGSRSTVLSLIQEAKAQSEVSEREKMGRCIPVCAGLSPFAVHLKPQHY